MVVRILKRGDLSLLPENKRYVGNCTGCKTEFEFQESDTKTTYDQREGEGWRTINCPFCGKSVGLPYYLGNSK